MELFLLGVLVCIVTGGFTAWLAAQKGFNPVAWFFLGLLFNLVALIALGFAPTKTRKEDEETVTHGEPPSVLPAKKINAGNSWICKCGATNPIANSTCNECGKYR